jgi:hypothetical protein
MFLTSVKNGVYDVNVSWICILTWLYTSRIPDSRSMSELKIAQVSQAYGDVHKLYPLLLKTVRAVSTEMWTLDNWDSDCLRPGRPTDRRSCPGRVRELSLPHVVQSGSLNPPGLQWIPEARDTLIGWWAVLQTARPHVRFLTSLLDFSVDLILPATLWPCSLICILTDLGLSSGLWIWLTTSPPYFNRLWIRFSPVGLHIVLQGQPYL